MENGANLTVKLNSEKHDRIKMAAGMFLYKNIIADVSVVFDSSILAQVYAPFLNGKLMFKLPVDELLPSDAVKDYMFKMNVQDENESVVADYMNVDIQTPEYRKCKVELTFTSEAITVSFESAPTVADEIFRMKDLRFKVQAGVAQYVIDKSELTDAVNQTQFEQLLSTKTAFKVTLNKRPMQVYSVVVREAPLPAVVFGSSALAELKAQKLTDVEVLDGSESRVVYYAVFLVIIVATFVAGVEVAVKIRRISNQMSMV